MNAAVAARDSTTAKRSPQYAETSRHGDQEQQRNRRRVYIEITAGQHHGGQPGEHSESSETPLFEVLSASPAFYAERDKISRYTQNTSQCRRHPSNGWKKLQPAKSQGILKLFLGYAPGVGKTYSMLSEAIRRASRGEEVVIAVVETHGRKATAELASKLEAIPRRKLEYKGTIFEEMDVDAVIARKPAVVVVDELAHTNIEGSKHLKRYEDVMELLENKIDVLSTMNVQHIESLGPTILQITGVQVRETVPDWVMQRVDEIVLADVTPQALQKRMMRGDVYPVERAGRALGAFLSSRQLDRVARAGAAAGDAGCGSQSRCVSGERGHHRAVSRPRAHTGVHQFQSGGAIFDCARFAHGARNARRTFRLLHRHGTPVR